MPKPAQLTQICIDNSGGMMDIERPVLVFRAQLKAIEVYCKAIFQDNPNHLVGLYGMSSEQIGILHPPTNDIKQVRSTLRGINCYGNADFDSALMMAAGPLLRRPPNMNNSLLFFVASPIRIVSTLVSNYGDLLKKHGVAVNIVNLFVLEDGALSKIKGRRGLQLEFGEFKYGRRELGIFVVHANNDGNSHVLDVKDPYSVFDVISNSILKKDLYLEEKHQKDAEENVDVKQQLEPSHKESVNVKAPGIQSFKKLDQCHNVKNKSTAQENVDVIQQLELSHKESVYVKAPGIQSFKKVGQCHNEKNKGTANDKIVQPQGIKQYPTKKTLPFTEKKVQHNPNANVNVKTRSGTLLR